MEVKKIVEGMTAQQVAQVIDDNFKAQNKILEEDIAKQNSVIGVSEYKDFSEAEAVNVGDVRKYEGFLYECVEDTTGAFDASKWKKSSFKAETEKKLSGLGLQNTIKGNLFRDLSSMNVFEGQMTGENKFYIPNNVVTSHFVMPVKVGEVISLKSSTLQPCVYALLKDYVIPQNGEPIILAEGETRKTVGVGQSVSFVIKDDVKFIAFNIQSGVNIYTPSSFCVNGFDFADSVFEHIAKIEENPFIRGYNEKIVTHESKGFYYAESNNFTDNENFSTTDFIEIGNLDIKAYIAVPYTINAITFFDEGKTLIGGVIGIESGLYLSEYQFSPKEYPLVRYIRITSRNTVEGYYSEYIKNTNDILEDIYKEKQQQSKPIRLMPSFGRFLGHSGLPTMEKEYQMFVCYGQSLSDGSDSLFVSDDVVPNTFMLSDIEGSGKELKSLFLNGNKQHPIVSCVNSFSLLYQTYFGKKNFIASSVGIGGRSIAQLSKGSRIEEYSNEYEYSIKEGGRYESAFLRAIDNAVSVVGDNKVECPAIIFLQGERDYVTDNQAPNAMPGSVDSAYACGGDKELYKKRMLDLKNDMQSDIMKKFGQSTKPIFCIYQVSGAFIKNDQMTINMAQFEFAQENDDVYLMPSPYFVPDYGAHLSTNGYRWYGEFLAKALFGILCNVSYWKPLLPYQCKIDGSRIVVSIENNVGKLELDSSLVELSTNYGFAVIVDGVYSANNIKSVMIDDNHVIIDCNQELTGKSVELVYGGNKTNGSGNVRDNDVYRSMYNYWDDSLDKGASGELTIRYKPNIIGQKYPMYNWLASFYKKIQ